MVKRNVKSNERQLSTEQEKLKKSNEIGRTEQKSGQKTSADKTNAARTRQCTKKQEKNLVCDEQLKVPKTDEGADHWVYCSEESCEILAML